MPIIKSAKKALRQAKRRQDKNRKWKDAVRGSIKTVEKAVVAKNNDAAIKAVPLAYKTIDKAVKNHILTKNRAARIKSRLTKLAAKK